jgi:hypothetical protein
MSRRRVTVRNAALLCLVAACGGDPTGLETGSLTLTVSGLPAGTPAEIHVAGPGGFDRDVTATATLSNLASGGYVVTAATVTTGSQAYAPSPTSQTVTVEDRGAPSGASVSYLPRTEP